MDPLTIAAICTLVLKNEAASTAVPPGTNCAQIERTQQANAAKANERVDDDSDREAIGRVAYHEAGNQGDRGIAAVVYTIINRVGSGRFGRTVSDVLNAPRQFEPVSRVGGSWQRLPPAPAAARARIDAIVGLALKGDLADETGGALYFQNPRIVANRERAGLVSRGLTNFGGQTPSAVIGDHSFYTGPRVSAVRSQTGTINLGNAGNGDQADFIAAGGGIFGESSSAAFDPANEARPSTAPIKPGDNAPVEIAARSTERREQSTINDGGQNARSDRQEGTQTAPQTQADDVGGMFVLSSGRTSTGPK
jgi:spore germination cell wall hydrolase CwlJ-like protein